MTKPGWAAITLTITLALGCLGACSDAGAPLAVDASAPDAALDASPLDASTLDAAPDAAIDALAPDADPAVPVPILRYAFDGSGANSGSLGPGLPGSATSATWVAGRHGQAIQFDGTLTSGFAIPGTAAAFSAHPQLTIGLWFREDPTASGPPITRYLIDDRCCPASTDRGFQAYHGSNPGLTTCSVGGCATFDYVAGAWHHLLYRYDATAGARIELFLDGAAVGTIANPGAVPIFGAGVGDLAIGTRTWFTVDDLVVYDQALSDQGQCEVVVGGTWDGSACALP